MKLPVFFKFPQSLIIFIPVSVFLKLLHFNDTLVFLSSALSIIPLADLLGKATEMLAAKTSPTLGGFLNASLGNLAELVIGFRSEEHTSELSHLKLSRMPSSA